MHVASIPVKFTEIIFHFILCEIKLLYFVNLMCNFFWSIRVFKNCCNLCSHLYSCSGIYIYFALFFAALIQVPSCSVGGLNNYLIDIDSKNYARAVVQVFDFKFYLCIQIMI